MKGIIKLLLVLSISVYPAFAVVAKTKHPTMMWHPTLGECMAAISEAEANDNTWQEDRFTKEQCTDVAIKAIDTGYRMMCEGGVKSACDMIN